MKVGEELSIQNFSKLSALEYATEKDQINPMVLEAFEAGFSLGLAQEDFLRKLEKAKDHFMQNANFNLEHHKTIEAFNLIIDSIKRTQKYNEGNLRR